MSRKEFVEANRCAWDYKMKSGKILWDELCAKYDEGAKQAVASQTTWQALAGQIDSCRHKEAADRPAIQVADSAKWRDQFCNNSLVSTDVPFHVRVGP